MYEETCTNSRTLNYNNNKKAEFFIERDDNNVCLPGKEDVH